MTDKMREEFEEWAKGDVCLDLSIFTDGGTYRDIMTLVAFDAWKASRAALCVELPEQWLDDDLECVVVTRQVVNALDAAGVRYK